jgi:tryptophan synthase alpha chain
VRRTRADVDTPLVLFTYANPVIRMGEDRFAHEAADAGIDGVLVLDYPIEEAGRLRTAIVDAGLDPILLVSPTTTDERIRRSADVGRGFLYLISRLGVTGVRDSLDGHVEHVAQRVRACTDMPLAVGFGISRPEHVAHACTFADAAVVGSALVQIVAEHGSSPEVVGHAADYVRWLKSAL